MKFIRLYTALLFSLCLPPAILYSIFSQNVEYLLLILPVAILLYKGAVWHVSNKKALWAHLTLALNVLFGLISATLGAYFWIYLWFLVFPFLCFLSLIEVYLLNIYGNYELGIFKSLGQKKDSWSK